MARIICRTSRSLSPVTLSRLTGLCWSDLNQDEEIFKNQIREREAAKRREAEARELEAELARLRLEEEQMAREEEERRLAEREKVLEKRKGVGRGTSRAVGSSSSGVRGVRGTRASMRARGVATGIARGRINPFFNGGAQCCSKVRQPPRVLESQVSPGLLRRHQLGRA